jgi:hypothetical protein
MGRTTRKVKKSTRKSKMTKAQRSTLRRLQKNKRRGKELLLKGAPAATVNNLANMLSATNFLKVAPAAAIKRRAGIIKPVVATRFSPRLQGLAPENIKLPQTRRRKPALPVIPEAVSYVPIQSAHNVAHTVANPVPVRRSLSNNNRNSNNNMGELANALKYSVKL